MNIYRIEQIGGYESSVNIDFDSNNPNDVALVRELLGESCSCNCGDIHITANASTMSPDELAELKKAMRNLKISCD